MDATEDILNIAFQPLNIEACQVLNLHSNDDGTVEIQMDLKISTVTSLTTPLDCELHIVRVSRTITPRGHSNHDKLSRYGNQHQDRLLSMTSTSIWNPIRV